MNTKEIRTQISDFSNLDANRYFIVASKYFYNTMIKL